jgi:ATP-dependent Clp protease ATP-binding subunit ClpC
MFERYTEPARRTLFYARYEVTHLGGHSIETEHLLLGLLRQARGVVERIFTEADVTYEAVRTEIDEVSRELPKLSVSAEIPFSAATKRVLQYAAEEADGLAHRDIGIEHLLLGLLRERNATAERTLTQKGLVIDRVREQVQGGAVT